MIIFGFYPVMNKFLAVFMLLLLSIACQAQNFEPVKGGFYFFSPTKHGFVGFSLVGIDVGVGEYVQRTNTISTFYADGSLQGSSEVDCRSGYTKGFANESNNKSYLLSYFFNNNNSFYKFILFRVDKEGDVDRININMKSEFGEVIGRSNYTLDLKYGLATSNSFVFIFGKYKNNSEELYLVEIKNGQEHAKIMKLDFIIEDSTLKDKTGGMVKFAFNGKNTLSAIQWVQRNNSYYLIVKDYFLKSFELASSREIALDFIGKNLFVTPNLQSETLKNYESYMPTILDREASLVKNYFNYEYVNNKLNVTGLYCSQKSAAKAEMAADGLFNISINKFQTTVSSVGDKVPFLSKKAVDKTPTHSYVFQLSEIYCSYMQSNTSKPSLSKKSSTPIKIELSGAGPTQALISYLDARRTLDKKYLKEKRSVLLQTINGLYCLYKLKQNSTGNYTKISVFNLSDNLP